MSDGKTLSFHTLPVNLVYHILDHLDLSSIVFSVREVCTRLNAITDTYHRYQVHLISRSRNDLIVHFFL